ncbi:hypothetical protein AKO1_012530, partial [Acrasis kona]
MMKTIMQSSGATRGVFIQSNLDGELTVVAEGKIDKSHVDVLRAVSLDYYQSVPKSVIMYVARTRETLSIGLGANPTHEQFKKDIYLEINSLCSVFCTPIMK